MKLMNSIKCVFMKKDERGIEEDINSLKYRFLLFFISVIIFIVAFVVSYSIYFSNQTNSFRDDIAVKRITNSSNEINKYVSFSIATRENQLYSIKLLLDNNKDKTDFEIMNSYLPNSTFDKIGFVKNDGYWFSDLTHDENTVVMDVKNSLSQNSVNLVANISVDHKNVYFCYNYQSSDPSILGIVGSISIDKLSQSFYSNIYNSSNSILIVKKSGEIITKTSEKYSHFFNENILFDLKTNFMDSFNTEEYISILNSSQTKVIELSNDDGEFEIYTANIIDYNDKSLNDLDLKLFVMVPKTELIYQVQGVTYLANITLFTAITISVIIIYILISLLQYNIIKTKKITAYDDKTGLLTIEQFKHDSYALLKRTKEEYSFCYINIVNFKTINQLQGVNNADELIKNIAKVIKEYFKEFGISSYFGADHFELCIVNKNIDILLKNFIIVLNRQLDNSSNTPIIAIGIKTARYEENYSVDDDIFRSKFAEEMLKGNYDNSVISHFDDKMFEVEKENAELITSAPFALINHEFEVYYQLKKNISDDSWSGSEALVRWNKGKNGLISPAKFINLFEENGFITELDLYVFEEVCKKLNESIKNGDKIVPVSVNLSKKHFNNLDFLNSYTEIVKKYDIPHEYIEFEITEGLVVENVSSFVSFISNIHSQGYLCSMDDFGSGYSSLNVIQEFDFDVIKIDSKFFRGSKGFDSDSKIIVSSIIELCHKLGKKVVAEGVETDEQVQFLKDNNCDVVQGYYYAKPIPWDDYKVKLNN